LIPFETVQQPATQCGKEDKILLSRFPSLTGMKSRIQRDGVSLDICPCIKILSWQIEEGFLETSAERNLRQRLTRISRLTPLAMARVLQGEMFGNN